MKRIVLILSIIFCMVIKAQDFGKWQNYTNLKDITKIAPVDGQLWASSSGGAFLYTSNKDFFTLTKSDGLSSQDLSAISIDKYGKIWIGTADGIINIYNPETGSIKKILDINRTEYTQKRINDIYFHENDAYISIDFGLSIIDIDSYVFKESVLKFGNLPSTTSVKEIYIDELIYVCNENGFAIQKENTTNLSNPESWQSYQVRAVPNGLPADRVYSSIVYRGEILVGTNTGLYKLNSGIWERKLFFTGDVVKLATSNSELIILTNSSAWRYNGTDASELISVSDQQFSDVASWQNRIYISSNTGFTVIENSSSEFIVPDGPSTNNFISVAVDQNSNVWAATGKDLFGAGFMKYDRETWTNYNLSTTPELPSNSYHKIFAYGNSVYVCNWGRGFASLENGEISIFDNATAGLSGVSWDPQFVVIQDVKVDDDNNTWVFNHLAADGNPIIVFRADGTKNSYRFPFFTLSEGNYIDNGAIDDNGTKWFSIQGRGLFYFSESGTFENTSDDKWGRLNQSEYFNNKDITSLAVDRRNELWVGTSLGIRIIPDPSRPTAQLLSVFPLRQQSINAIAVDALNRKWIGTSQGLFYVSSDGSALIEQYDSKNSPLPSDEILSIAVDDNTGIVYVGTSQGLSALQTTAIKPNEDFSELRAYPNPFLLSKNNSSALRIDGLIERSSIKILSITGKLIREFETVGGKLDTWDGKNENGELVPSGIYLIVAFDEEANQVETAKVAVIRE